MVSSTRALLLATVGIVSAQVIGIPNCALSCFQSATSQSGCQTFDYFCQCTTGQATIQRLTAPCICKQCDAAEQSLVHQATNSICFSAFLANGLNYTETPDTNVCSTTSTGSSSTATTTVVTSTASAASTTGNSGAAATSSHASDGAVRTPTNWAVGSLAILLLLVA